MARAKAQGLAFKFVGGHVVDITLTVQRAMFYSSEQLPAKMMHRFAYCSDIGLHSFYYTFIITTLYSGPYVYVGTCIRAPPLRAALDMCSERLKLSGNCAQCRVYCLHKAVHSGVQNVSETRFSNMVSVDNLIYSEFTGNGRS